ncbi:MAG: non-heme iron oxygenase ferredoxin subunit [Chloroflexi bacterium]|nr:non-heme iron oxygenase ferredoxin subunit [Chloroflexota bacterium]
MEHDASQYEFFAFGDAADLPPGERWFIDVEDRPVMVANLGGKYYAIADVCTHDDGPLGDGDIDGCEIICPRHGARFDLRTGEALTLPAVTPTNVYPVREREGKLEIGILKK